MENQRQTADSPHAESSASSSRKRRRPPLACESCRARKIKCDRKTPCNKCVRSKKARSCTYVLEQDNAVAELRSPRQSAPHQRQSPQPGVQPVRSLSGVVGDRPFPKTLQQALDVGERATPEVPPAPQSPSPSFLTANSSLPPKAIRIKGKLFGASHWANTAEHLPKMFRFEGHDAARHPQVRALLIKCKKYARDAKRHPPVYEATKSELREKVPPRHIADQLVEHYLGTFETVFRIHHVPSFREAYRQYWSDSGAASDAFTVKLLLVLALGTCFEEDSAAQAWHASSVHWIIAAHAWANSPYTKSRVTLDGVQIQCLLVLARQTHAVGGDMIWISAGTLLRTAMLLGLNRDPSHIEESAPVEAEVRRRVWATTVELLVQASIDSGQPPLISTDDFDCERPSDFDDFRLHNGSHGSEGGKDQAVTTGKSAQNILLDSLPVRLQIAKFLNHFRSDLSYSTALNLSAQLTRFIRIHSSSLKESTESEKFQRKMVEFLTHRFLIPLHHVFASKATTSPAFYFSRRMCLDASLLVLNSTRPEPGAQLYRKLMALGNGLYHTTLLHAAACIVLELMWQNDEASSLSSLVTQSSLLSQQEQKAAIRSYATLVGERLKKGQGNFKVYVLVGLAVAQLDNLEGEGAVDGDMVKHMESMLQECAETLAKTLPGRSDTQDNQGSIQAEELGDLDFNISEMPLDFDTPELFSLSDELFADKGFWLFQS